MTRRSSLALSVVLVTSITLHATPGSQGIAGTKLEWIGLSSDGTGFVRGDSGGAFLAWGVNYDHDGAGRLLEEYWIEEWPTVVEDCREIKALGANVIRIHLQVASFMRGPKDVRTSVTSRSSACGSWFASPRRPVFISI